MNYTSYCTAEHPNVTDGCYGAPNHFGKHHSISCDVKDDTHPDGEWKHGDWYWGEDAPVAESAETFTDEELAILITALQPVKHFFPGLEAKLHRARAAVQ